MAFDGVGQRRLTVRRSQEVGASEPFTVADPA
jgi:hypothetical protein